jgi:hypothetical protein
MIALLSAATLLVLGLAQDRVAADDAALSVSKREFNARLGSVRLVVVTSPTCARCQEGVRIVQNEVLSKIDDPRLSVLVVWTQVMPDDSRDEAEMTARLIPDKRVRHTWDYARSAGEAFANVLPLPGSHRYAFDVFLLYGPKVKWTGGPPRPTAWMQRLERGENFLDPAALKDAIRALLKAESSQSRP